MVARSRALKHLLFVVALLFFLAVSLQSHAQNVHHQLNVELQPALNSLKVTDRVRLPSDTPKKISFLLHKNFKIQSVDDRSKVTLINPGSADTVFSEWGLEVSRNEFTIEYSGKLDAKITDLQPDGIINSETAYLAGSTYWYPTFIGSLHTFQLNAIAPANWVTLTQGQKTASLNQNGQTLTTWSGIYPQQEIYLLAGPFFEYVKSVGNGKNIRILLRKDEKDLAHSFLNVIPGYLDHYSQEIASYPYTDFSVVENLWETGYGMPAFTLLGPSVVRLPFILNTSLPHEILHNWWGNGVYVDYSSGNWSEGLTTYMADHWQQKVLKQDANYRLNTLISYADYVKAGKDFPIREFRGREDASSQAVGYGKTMMFFHMLEVQHGSDIFRRSLQNFYSEKSFKVASFTDIQTSFEKISGKSLQAEFNQWLDRKGAPTIVLEDLRSAQLADGDFNITFTIKQTQTELYDLNIPVRLTLENGKILEKIYNLKTHEQNLNFAAPSKPAKIEIDPDYNLFRSLYTEERPVTLSAALGSSQVSFYYPEDLIGAEDFIRTWQGAISGKTQSHPFKENLSISSQGAIVFIGDDSRFAYFMKTQLAGQDFDILPEGLRLQSNIFESATHSWLVLARNRSNPDQIVVWVRWAPQMPVAEWAKRLTHYGSFSALAFKEKPNVLKITWPVISSPLRRSF